MAIASYSEESITILLFVKSEFLKFFLHKSNERAKFFMADTSHRIFSLTVSTVIFFTCVFNDGALKEEKKL